jgi:16S rRNA processing protein RimM
MSENRLIPVAKLVRTHGVRGALKIYAYGESLAAQSAGDRLFLQSASGKKRSELTLAALQPQGKLWIAVFEEISSIGEAQEMVGEELFLPEDRLSPTEEGEYYHYQLIGLKVETLDGRTLGTLQTIIETGGNDVYVIDVDGKELLVPAVEEVVSKVDLESRVMVIDPPEGLLDDL